MNEGEIKQLLADPKRVLNIARVFHQLLHATDKMEEEKAKQQDPKGVQRTHIKDKLEITCKDKDGNIKSELK